MFYILMVWSGIALGAGVAVLAQKKDIKKFTERMKELKTLGKNILLGCLSIFVTAGAFIELYTNWDLFIAMEEIKTWNDIIPILFKIPAFFHAVTFGAFFTLLALLRLVMMFALGDWTEMEFFGIKAKKQEIFTSAKEEVALTRKLERQYLKMIDVISQDNTRLLVKQTLRSEKGVLIGDSCTIMEDVCVIIRNALETDSLTQKIEVGYAVVHNNSLLPVGLKGLDEDLEDCFYTSMRKGKPVYNNNDDCPKVVVPIRFGTGEDLFFLLYLHGSSYDFCEVEQLYLGLIGNILNTFVGNALIKVKEEQVS